MLRTRETSIQLGESEEPNQIDKKRRLTTISVITGAIGTALCGILGNNKEDDSRMTFRELFQSAHPLDIPREKIPEFLPILIKPYGQIINEPENPNPNNPNLYIIGDLHVRIAGIKQDHKENLPIQAEELAIFHVLYSLGVRNNFNEAIEAGYELRHDGPVTKMGKAIPDTSVRDDTQLYELNGGIKRVKIAIEGIYENDVFSTGIETKDYYAKGKMMFSEKMKARKAEILKSIKMKLIEIFTNKSRLDEKSKKEIAKKMLFENPEYLDLVKMQGHQMHYFLHERNEQWINFLNGNTSEDSSIIIGAGHVQYVYESLDHSKFNVWTIAANTTKKKYPKLFFKELQTIEDCVARYFNWDLKHLISD